jgi:hypothetical protein
MDRDASGLAGSAVLEFPPFAGKTVVRPAATAAGFGVGKQHFAPSLVREAHQVLRT